MAKKTKSNTGLPPSIERIHKRCVKDESPFYKSQDNLYFTNGHFLYWKGEPDFSLGTGSLADKVEQCRGVMETALSDAVHPYIIEEPDSLLKQLKACKEHYARLALHSAEVFAYSPDFYMQDAHPFKFAYSVTGSPDIQYPIHIDPAYFRMAFEMGFTMVRFKDGFSPVVFESDKAEDGVLIVMPMAF